MRLWVFGTPFDGTSLTYKFVANANPLLQRRGGDDDAVDKGQQRGLVVQGWGGGGTRQLQFVDDNLEAVALLLEILQGMERGFISWNYNFTFLCF